MLIPTSSFYLLWTPQSRHTHRSLWLETSSSPSITSKVPAERHPGISLTAEYITRFVFYSLEYTSFEHVLTGYQALLSVFKSRVGDPMREKDTAVEKCDVSIEDGEGKAKSRFIIKIMCRHGEFMLRAALIRVWCTHEGVLKTYRLTFESIAPLHALFVKESANNLWAISSRTLREFVEHFGPGTEQLDIYSEDGRVSLTSYTEKIMSGNGKMIINIKF